MFTPPPHASHVRCYMSNVRYQVSRVRCHVPHVRCSNMFIHIYIFFYKKLELVGGGFVINEAYPVQFEPQCPHILDLYVGDTHLLLFKQQLSLIDILGFDKQDRHNAETLVNFYSLTKPRIGCLLDYCGYTGSDKTQKRKKGETTLPKKTLNSFVIFIIYTDRKGLVAIKC